MSEKLFDFLNSKSDNIKMKNREHVEKKLIKLIEDGRDKLQFVMDFDDTLTKQRWENGKQKFASGDIFAMCPSICPEYREIFWKNQRMIEPIGYDPNISMEEKSRMLDVAYNNILEALLGKKLPFDEVSDLSKELSEQFRDGVDDFLNILNMENIPLLIISSGLGNGIIQILNSKKYHTSNIRIISNFVDHDEEGRFLGIKGKIIHVFNKNKSSSIDAEVHDFVKSRSNVILAGDSLADSIMADAFDNIDTVLKIGFLAHEKLHKLSSYMDRFDIVLIDDESVDVIINILKCI